MGKPAVPAPWWQGQRQKDPNFQAGLGYMVDTVSKMKEKNRKKALLSWSPGVESGNNENPFILSQKALIYLHNNRPAASDLGSQGKRIKVTLGYKVNL